MLRTYNKTWCKICPLFLNIVKRGSGEKHEIIQIAIFPIIFVTGGLKKSEKLNIWISKEIWVIFQGNFSDFFQVKPNYEHYKEDFTKRLIVHEISASGT